MSHALELAQAACGAAEADEMDALVQTERSGLARFAASAVHQPTLVENEVVTLRVVRAGRIGCARTNRTDRESLRLVARRAEQAADSAPIDRGFPGLPVPALPSQVEGFDPAVAALGPDEQAALAWSTIGAAQLPLFGYFTSGVSEIAVASSTGVAVAQKLTDASVLALAADESRSGYAETTSWRLSDLDCAAVAREAAEKGARTSAAGTLEPGVVRAVLEPYAVSELLWAFGMASFGALAFLEGRSCFSGRLGEQLFHESFTVVDDPLDPRGLPKAFDFEGVPRQRVVLAEAGVARDVVWDRRTAARAEQQGRHSTGHALPAPQQSSGPLPLNLSLAPGDATLDQLVSRVEHGIYVTRLHYLGVVDPLEGVITGMTRDGTFAIESGRIGKPLVNLRFTTSFPQLARSLLGLTQDVVLVNRNDFYEERYPLGTLVPGLATERLQIVGSGSSPGL